MTEEDEPKPESKPRGGLAGLAVGLVALLVALAGIGLSAMQPAPPAPQTREYRVVIAAFEPHNESMMMEEMHMFLPSTIFVNMGDTIRLTVVNMDEHRHGLKLAAFNVQTDEIGGDIGPGEEVALPAFVADRAGVFEFVCNVPYDPPTPPAMDQDCGEDHGEMMGALIVRD